jgi:hypothetical protein
MRGSQLILTLSLLAGGGIIGVLAQQPGTPVALTAEDYRQIQMLYGAYNRWLDFGVDDPDGSRGVQDVYTSDGMFVDVGAATTPCVVRNGWQAGSRDVIRGTVADQAGLNLCIATLTGFQALANDAKETHQRLGVLGRHLMRNTSVRPSPEGASGFATVIPFTWEDPAGKFSAPGHYEDTFVKTANGWRIKKRIWTPDSVLEGLSRKP